MSRRRKPRLWDLDDLVGSSDVARRYGVGRAAVSNWVRREPDFPTALATVAGHPIYSRTQVEAWYAQRFGDRAEQLLERAEELEQRAAELREAAAEAEARRRGAASR